MIRRWSVILRPFSRQSSSRRDVIAGSGALRSGASRSGQNSCAGILTETRCRAYARDSPAGQDGDSGALAAPAPGPRAEADLLGQPAALAGIIWRDHRVIRRQRPAFAILLGGHVVGGLQVPLQHLQALAVFEADDVVGL